MSALFWLSLATVAYAYVGYALLLMLLVRIRPLPVRSAPIEPRISILLAVHNEERYLERKLANVQSLVYPAEQLEIVVVSDGSTDDTNAILGRRMDRVHPILLPSAGGKAVALNHAVAASTGEILVFMDARQEVDSEALRALVAPFADAAIGAVSGELHLENADGTPSADALGVYWKIEKTVRRLESATGSVVGVTGALFALRRELFVPLPPGTLLDDVWTPMHAVRAGKRVLFTEHAVARDRIFSEPGKEFGRKVRTLTGNYQLLQLAPWLLSFRNPLLFRLVSHKLLRLAVPGLLVIMLLTSALGKTSLSKTFFALQLVVYLLAGIGKQWPRTRQMKLVSIPYTFVLLNVAAAIAFYNLLRGRARWV